MGISRSFVGHGTSGFYTGAEFINVESGSNGLTFADKLLRICLELPVSGVIPL